MPLDSILYTVLYTLYSTLHSTLYFIQYTLHSTLYFIQYTTQAEEKKLLLETQCMGNCCFS